MTARRCSCDPWAPDEACPVHGDEEHRAPAPCPNCHRVPEDGERHQLLDGVTEDGEPLGFTCLDPAGEVIFDPPPSLPPGTLDPWSQPGPVPPPPF